MPGVEEVRKRMASPMLHLRDILESYRSSLAPSAVDLRYRSAWSNIWPLTTPSTNPILSIPPAYLAAR